MNLFRKRRTVMKGQMSNVDVDLVSLLFDEVMPANQKGAIAKSQNGKQHAYVRSTAKFKSDDQGRLYVTVMEPDTVDAQGDTCTKEEIQKACDHFSRKGMVGKNDINHNFKPIDDCYVAENSILKAKDDEHYPDTKIGSWVQTIKFDNLASPYWQKVKKKQFNGVSIYGHVDDENSSSPELAKLAHKVDSLKDMLKGFKDKAKGDEFDAAISEIEKQIAEAEGSQSDAKLDDAINRLGAAVENMGDKVSKAISKSLHGEPGGTVADRTVKIKGIEIVIKAEKRELYKSIANVDSGQPMNILTENMAGLFIDEVIASNPSDTLSDITVTLLQKDEKIDAGLIDDLVFTNSLDGSPTAQAISTGDISCPTGILTAEITLSKETVEFYKDKYGEEAFGAYVEKVIAGKAEKALRKLLFKGDRDSATPALAALDGVIVQASDASAITDVNPTTYDTWSKRFEQVLLTFSDDMLEEKEGFVIYVSHKDHIRIAAEIAARPTQLGDKLLMEGGKLSYGGIPVKERLLPDNYIVAGLAKFIILGVRTDVELKKEHHGSDWKWHFYLRLRAGITYVNGFALVFHLVEPEPEE